MLVFNIKEENFYYYKPLSCRKFIAFNTFRTTCHRVHSSYVSAMCWLPCDFFFVLAVCNVNFRNRGDSSSGLLPKKVIVVFLNSIKYPSLFSFFPQETSSVIFSHIYVGFIYLHNFSLSSNYIFVVCYNHITHLSTKTIIIIRARAFRCLKMEKYLFFMCLKIQKYVTWNRKYFL